MLTLDSQYSYKPQIRNQILVLCVQIFNGVDGGKWMEESFPAAVSREELETLPSDYFSNYLKLINNMSDNKAFMLDSLEELEFLTKDDERLQLYAIGVFDLARRVACIPNYIT